MSNNAIRLTAIVALVVAGTSALANFPDAGIPLAQRAVVATASLVGAAILLFNRTAINDLIGRFLNRP